VTHSNHLRCLLALLFRSRLPHHRSEGLVAGSVRGRYNRWHRALVEVGSLRGCGGWVEEVEEGMYWWLGSMLLVATLLKGSGLLEGVRCNRVRRKGCQCSLHEYDVKKNYQNKREKWVEMGSRFRVKKSYVCYRAPRTFSDHASS
jgi:hypothetical protein